MTTILLIIAKRRLHGEIIHVKSKTLRTRPQIIEKKKIKKIIIKSSSKAERASMATIRPDSCLV